MKEKAPDFGPQIKFPIKRLLRTFILGNMVTLGVIFSGGILGEFLDNLQMFFYYFDGDYSELSRHLLGNARISVKGFFKDLFDPLNFLLYSILAGFVSITWYIVARQLETRALKKRWLILKKSQSQES